MRSDFQINDEPLPGYRLIERLGAGGYGEVWRTEAPGGLTKAIKLVFGQQHEKRAVRELRALELIRQLRHPFLLSIERIEIVDGRVLIVTELADGSVKDRFDACVQKGLVGIPREEMLRYVRDAADALDYMSEQHGLQHLDIKPENLLLLADHVKVADFGLVKDVKQSVASLVGGLTPLYAAPEVFRGLPGQQSDQYSLAIVFQEMVSGRLPFVGGNAAELTLQHLNDEPNLSSLSGPERYVISRALSKDPSHRYATCREFVEALAQPAMASTNAQDSEPASTTTSFSKRCAESATKTSVPTEFFEDQGGGSGKGGQLLLELPAVDPTIVDLPPIQVDGSTFRPSPVLFLGIGGAAGRVLWNIRSGMIQQYGDQPIPAVQMLLVDTDPQSLAEVTGIDGPGLTLEETLNVPLRRPQHYRERWDQLLSWLSRRWLYNIPKSLRTEGLRPLGRLAFVDHARQTCQRIRRGMIQAIEPDSITASTAITGHEFCGDALRIYIVASVSGGTGSGAVLDVAYAVRAMLKRIDVSMATIIGIMTHSTGCEPRHCELARVNAYSWLTEFHHFQQPAMPYPGDSSCGLPAHDAGVNGFDHTYVVHLGDGLDEREFNEATQSVAEYLLLDALSPAQVLMDGCRANSSRPNARQKGVNDDPNLRSCGIHLQAAVPSELCGAAAQTVGAHLVQSWQGSNTTMETPDRAEKLGVEAKEFVNRHHVTVAGIAAKARSLMEGHLGCDAATFIGNWITQRISASQDTDARRWEAVDDVFANKLATNGGEPRPSLMGQFVADIVSPLAEKLGEEVRRWVIGRLELPGSRAATARRYADWLRQHFESVHNEVHQYRGPLAASLAEMRRPPQGDATHRDVAAAAATVAEANLDRLTNYFELRLDELALQAAQHIARCVAAELKWVGDDLTAFGRELGHIASAGLASKITGKHGFAVEVGDDADNKRILALVEANLDDLAAATDTHLQESFVDNEGGLFRIVMHGGRPRAQLAAKIQEFARHAVQDLWAQADNSRSELSGANGQSSNEGQLRSAISDATPAALEFGGARRVLAVLPRGKETATTASELSRSAGVGVSTVEGNDGNLTLCVEAERVSLKHLAASLVEWRRDSMEFAKRVHSRADIAWTPLFEMSAEPVEDPSGLTTVSMAIDPAVRQTEVV